MVYTDQKNLIKEALVFTSDQVNQWRLRLEEYGPDIVRIICIHNTVTNAISNWTIALSQMMKTIGGPS